MRSADLIATTITDGSAALAACSAHFAADRIGSNMVAASLREGESTELIHVANSDATLGAAVRWANGFTLTRIDDRAIGPLAAALPTDSALELRADAGVAAAVAGRWSERCGGSIVLEDLMRMHRLGELHEPTTAGALVIADTKDLALSAEWGVQFGADIGHRQDRAGANDQMGRAIAEGRLWLWLVDGTVVAQLLTSPERFGVVRIGGVYTPPERRQNGFAAALTAAVSANLRSDPAVTEVVLNTQASNAMTNRLYRRIGFESVFDTLVLSLVPG